MRCVIHPDVCMREEAQMDANHSFHCLYRPSTVTQQRDKMDLLV